MYYPISRNSTTASSVSVNTMSRASRATPSYDLLRPDLNGSFTARTRGLLAPEEFVILTRDGEEFGRLYLGRISDAELRSGEYVVRLEALGRRYRMILEDEQILAAEPKGRSLDELEIFCNRGVYEARFAFLRNLATASRQRDGERAVRLSGSLMGRSYKAVFSTGDECALPVAVLLLWHTVVNRRRAYRTVGLREGEAV